MNKQELLSLKSQYEIRAKHYHDLNTEQGDIRCVQFERLVTKVDDCLNQLSRFERELEELEELQRNTL
jgi:hypothetical protein|tara:strand:+ start:20248 stop:20451 length:204 start_codon:yes stop_codon:yes gene_type:complete